MPIGARSTLWSKSDAIPCTHAGRSFPGDGAAPRRDRKGPGLRRRVPAFFDVLSLSTQARNIVENDEKTGGVPLSINLTGSCLSDIEPGKDAE